MLSDDDLRRFREALMTDLKSAEAMLERQPSVLHQADPVGETALHYLVVENGLDAVRWLIARGAHVDGSKSDQTPLGDAASLGYPEMIRLLLDAGAQPDAGGALIGTPLQRAATPEIVDLLVSGGADLHLVNEHGNAVLCAIREGRREVAEHLIELGASIDAVNELGHTCLHLAVLAGDPALLRWVLGLVSNVDPVDEMGFTPLHLAAASGSEGIVEVLLERGADPSLATASGEKPTDVARRVGHEELARYLESRTAT